MPPPPEFLDGLGKVGSVEVFRQADAQHPGSADGHGGAAGKVAQNLQGVEHGGKHQADAGEAFDISIDGIHQNGGPVGNHQLLKIAPGQGQKTRPEVLKAGLFRGGILGQQLIPPADGAGNQLGKEGDKQGKPDKVLLRGIFSLVNIHQIPGSLEGEKGDAHGQNQIQPGKAAVCPQLAQQLFQGIEGKIRVFEQGQHAKKDGQATPKGPLPVPEKPGGEIDHQCAAEQQQAVALAEAAVKIVACQQQRRVFPPGGDQTHGNQNQGEKQQKRIGIKQHRPSRCQGSFRNDGAIIPHFFQKSHSIFKESGLSLDERGEYVIIKVKVAFIIPKYRVNNRRMERYEL